MKLIFLALVVSPVVFAGTVVNQVMGSVGQHIVTSREVKMNAIVERALFPGPDEKKAGAFPTLSLTPEQTGKELSRLLIEWTVYLEAQTFKVAAPSEVEIKASEKAFLQALSEKKYSRSWEELDVTNKELLETVDRKVRAKRFIAFKTKASLVPVTDAEALRYFQKNKNKFGDRPFSQFRETIKGFLGQNQADERIHDWFVVLQKKYSVRRLDGHRDEIDTGAKSPEKSPSKVAPNPTAAPGKLKTPESPAPAESKLGPSFDEPAN